MIGYFEQTIFLGMQSILTDLLSSLAFFLAVNVIAGEGKGRNTQKKQNIFLK